MLSQRIEDVRMMTKAYFETTKATTIEQLIETLRQRGVRLKNPIVADASLPCYRLVYKPEDTNTTIVIEETKMLDKHIIVRSGAGRSVFLQRREE